MLLLTSVYAIHGDVRSCVIHFEEGEYSVLAHSRRHEPPSAVSDVCVLKAVLLMMHRTVCGPHVVCLFVCFRKAALEKFMGDSRVKVFVLTLRSAAVGISEYILL